MFKTSVVCAKLTALPGRSIRRIATRPAQSVLIIVGWASICLAWSIAAAAEIEVAGAFGQLDRERLAHTDREPDQWFTPGRDANGTFYSPLDSINDHNVVQLGFAWEYRLGTKRGVEGTAVVIDGVMFAPGNWGRVYALDATTGRELWVYDPQVDGQYGRYSCCDVVSRGLAVWKGRVYAVSLDGYLHAIDARTGKRIWKVDTLPERGPKAFHYTVTGAPLLAGDNIVIGNGGGDFKGARGSISAYDLDSGTFRWRFYTVPRDPKLGPQDQSHLIAAAKTWPADYDWSFGAGGSAWDGLAYDAELGLVYLGTGNASPYHGQDKIWANKDELYISSIIGVNARTGRMQWYFQEIPGEGWDYDTANKLILADLPVKGVMRKTIMQASKNGFLYLLDRATGEFLSGKPFAYVNWTKGLDPKTRRPIPQPAADWTHRPALLFPGTIGAHGWQPMSFNPKTGLVYIPVNDAPNIFFDTSNSRAGLIEGNFDLNFIFPEDYDPKDLESLYGKLPTLKELSPNGVVPKSRGWIRAYEPVSGKLAWEQPTHSAWDGGVLSTGGNLVVRGDGAGTLNFYAADTGKLLKQIDVGTYIMAAPMTYRLGGVQYISVMAGYGGGLMALPFPKDSAPAKYANDGRIVTFRLDGGITPKPARVTEPPAQPLPPREGSAESIALGEVLHNRYCSRCHVFGHGLLPDLRRLSPTTHQLFYEIVLNGVYAAKGMGRWDDVFTRKDAEAIHAYLVDQAWQLGTLSESATSVPRQ